MEQKYKKFPGKSFRVPMDKDVLKFEQAILKNPEDADAFTGLAVSYIVLWCYGFLSKKDSQVKAQH